VIDWVVFDLGNVLLKSTAALPDLARVLAVEEASATDAYFAHRSDYDVHSDPARYWGEVSARLGLTAPDLQLVEELVRIDDLGWSVTDSETLGLMGDLAVAGASLAVLSNAPASMGRLIEAQEWSAGFRHLLFSGDLGIAKPSAEIYQGLLHKLGAEPAAVAFLDDRADNIAGAVALGIHGLLFTGAAQARVDLRALGLAV